ncbi:MAG: DUF4160 domain-containing protein [Pseudomonadota bacterium]|nr:DUF4160 domain-containing protein [Pseudomonadota bacterium]
MPTALRDGPYRFFFYASDCGEPSHIHVERDDNIARFWLSPVRLASSGGFPRAEIARVQRMVMERQFELKEAWNAYCQHD